MVHLFRQFVCLSSVCHTYSTLQSLAIPVGSEVKMYDRTSWKCVSTFTDDHHKEVSVQGEEGRRGRRMREGGGGEGGGREEEREGGEGRRRGREEREEGRRGRRGGEGGE